MNLFKRINYKLLSAWFFLVSIFCLSLINLGNIKEIIASILEWKNISIAYWLLILSCYIIRILSKSEIETESNSLVHKHFGKFADAGFTVVTLSLAGSTSLALLKGVYGQMIIGNAIYFKNFDNFDIWSLLVVAIFLLVYSLHMALSALYFSIINTSAIKVEPVDGK